MTAKLRMDGELVMSEPSIPVFFSTDNNYAVPCYIAIFSLLHNYRGDQKISIILLTTGGFSDKNKSLIQSLSGKFRFAEIRILDMGNVYETVNINNSYISVATMYRLLIPRLAGEYFDDTVEKCVYLDSDVVVEGDIQALFNIDLEGYCIGGVRERTASWLDLPERQNTLGIPSLKNYINAGVLLINLKEIKLRGLADKLEATGYRDDFPSHDQDAINAVCYDKIKVLPLKYNAINWYLYDETMDNIENYGLSNIREARKEPLIIHYIVSPKPWSCKDIPMAKAWWKYANMQDDDVIKDYIAPYIKEHKLPLRVRIKEKIRKIIIALGLYTTVRKIIIALGLYTTAREILTIVRKVKR